MVAALKQTVPVSVTDPGLTVGIERSKRVLIVDDSVVVRGLFSRWITEQPGLIVVGFANNGRTAIAESSKLQPDVIILDLDMPELDGMAALPEILARSPNSAVLIASTLTRRNARLSLRCLAMGAVDVLSKPDSNRDLTISLDFRREFIGRVQALAHAQSTPQAQPKDARLPAAEETSGLVTNLAPYTSIRPRYLLIGASTGGPQAVSRVLADIGPALQHVTTLVVQHMPAVFTASFADQIGSLTGRVSREPDHHERLCQGNIYIAPGGRHLGMARHLGHMVARIDDGAPVRYCRPAVDILFADAAQILGPSALGLVLTGMGTDGTNGAHALRQSGAAIIAQDEASSTVWGMPGSITKAGLASKVMSLETIGPAIRALVMNNDRDQERAMP